MRFTLGLTFMSNLFSALKRAVVITEDFGLLVAVHDSAAVQVVWSQLHNNSILRQDLDVVLTHLARNVGEHNVPVRQLYTEHRIGQRLNNASLYLDDTVFLSHNPR